ncbi:MAG: fold metallo-hydrolase [Thermoleophilia bacterium]|nr:fold metallo-hydrolase [Thermoleophilia bacterium]
MIVTRSMHSEWRSNSYLVADEAGGHAVFIDAGAPIEPLMSKVDELGVRVTHILLTHEHHDHTTHMMALEEAYGATLVLPERAMDGIEVKSGSLHLRSVPTPGHCSPHVAWLVEDAGSVVAAFTGDVLFQGAVGGTLDGGVDGVEQLRSSILDELLALPADTVLYPGHMEATTVAAELESNVFVRAWRGDEPVRDDAVQFAGTDVTLLLEGPDYDGGTKAWVRFEDGREAIVGGSMITTSGARA